MRRPIVNRTRFQEEALMEAGLHPSQVENPDLMLVFEDGSLISQATVNRLYPTFRLLTELSKTPAKQRKQLDADAYSLLQALHEQNTAVPQQLSHISQQYGMSVDGVTFTQDALNYARHAISFDRGEFRTMRVTTDLAPEKFQKKADATTR